MAKQRKDSKGRIWNYCESEGTWSHGKHLIGCGANNGSKWMNWNSDSKHPEEFKTLKAAQESCR